MSWKIGMPNLGHTMEEGTVSEWLKAVGDAVRQGEVIAVVESDKASFDVESPADGVLLAIEVPGGTVVPVGATIGVVGLPGEALEAPSAAAPDAGVAQHAPASSRSAAAVASELPATRSGRVKISPAARALAEQLGLDPAAVVPSGDDGMVTRDDVRAYAEAGQAVDAGTIADAGQAAGTGSAVFTGQPTGSGTATGAANTAGPTPLSPMRRAIADATQRAWQSIPHVALQSHADVGALLEAGGTSLTAAVARACALALGEHPAFNGWLGERGFERAPNVNLALAVATPGGLVAAVVPQAETRSVAELRDAIGRLAESARAGRLDGASMLGGSFTISTLGRWGVDAFAPIISAPQVAILGVGRVNRVAREGPGNGVRFASELGLTLVFDHRANDGVQAAQLLGAIVGYLEQPQRLELTT